MPPKKVLLVDDSSASLSLQSLLLSWDANYQIFTAKNGAEALSKAAETEPDLILLDVVMPKLNGFDTCKALRQHIRTKNTPIIMVTTRGDQSSIDTGFACGCTDFLTKPIDARELHAKVRSALGIISPSMRPAPR
jgi:DNA-binding response OmpR family regulator